MMQQLKALLIISVVLIFAANCQVSFPRDSTTAKKPTGKGTVKTNLNTTTARPAARAATAATAGSSISSTNTTLATTVKSNASSTVSTVPTTNAQNSTLKNSLATTTATTPPTTQSATVKATTTPATTKAPTITTKNVKNSVSTTIATTTTEEVTEETTEEVTEETTADPGAETTEDPGAETSEDPNIGASSDQPTEETTEETTEPPTEEPVTRQHSDVYNNCMCVTNGSCRIVGGNSTVINDGSGNIDARIVNPSKGSDVIGGTNESITRPVSSGIPLIAEAEFDCTFDSENLDLCCPANGYQCGYVFPPMPGSRILGGRAKFGEFPWQGIVFTQDYNYVGSGVLIDQKHFLTVAHRLRRFPNATFIIRMGEWDTSSRSEPLSSMEFIVSSVFIHPNYNSSNLRNSIAILRLGDIVPLGRLPTIGTACLSEKPIRGLRCFVSGWGRNDFAYGSNQAIQRKVDLPIVDSDKCQAKLRMTRLGKNFILDPGFMCAGGEAGKDACTGDGGTPLVCQIAGRWYVAGLVTWGISCGQDLPGVYMDVNYYISWIQSITSSP